MLVFEPEEKEVIRKARDLINQYCDEMEGCKDCPFDDLCTRMQNSDRGLNVPDTFSKIEDIVYEI